MKYLQAVNHIKSLADDAEEISVLMASSFQSEAWDIYVQAQYALLGKRARIDHLPFGSLQQHLLTPIVTSNKTLLLLCPWDILPHTDWRSGFNSQTISRQESLAEIEAWCSRFLPGVDAVLYFDCPLKPSSSDLHDDSLFRAALRAGIATHSKKHCFIEDVDLNLYFHTGQMINGQAISQAVGTWFTVLNSKPVQRKIIVTDLDHTIWHGVIGEDGLEKLQWRNEGAGYPHYLYQTLLLQLQQQGVLLAVVSKNDLDLALQPFKQGHMPLKKNHFVHIAASYEAKSAQILALSESLNLPLDSFIFVDDNPIEIEEVSQAHPSILTLQFNPDTSSLTRLFQTLLSELSISNPTDEDRQRTAHYKTRMAMPSTVETEGQNLTAFLKSLNMTLRIRQVEAGDHQRSLQLFNKTNQFNLNGYRITETELLNELNHGAYLWSSELTDRYGSHGEILCCLFSEGKISHLAMSCRVLNRRVEAAFLIQLHEFLGTDVIPMAFEPTERNTPFQKFTEIFGENRHSASLLSANQEFLETVDLITVEKAI